MQVQEIQPEVIGTYQGRQQPPVIPAPTPEPEVVKPTPEAPKTPTRGDLDELGKKVAEFTVSLLESEFEAKYRGEIDTKDSELKKSSEERKTENETFKNKAKTTEETHKKKSKEMETKHKEIMKEKDRQMKEMAKT